MWDRIQPTILLISGPLGIGKSKLCARLLEQLNTDLKIGIVFKRSFAGPLKRMYAKRHESECPDMLQRMEHDSEFKMQHRQGLIELASELRAKNDKIFAQSLWGSVVEELDSIQRWLEENDDICQHILNVMIIVDDWRHLCELQYLANHIYPCNIWTVRLADEPVLRRHRSGEANVLYAVTHSSERDLDRCFGGNSVDTIRRLDLTNTHFFTISSREYDLCEVQCFVKKEHERVEKEIIDAFKAKGNAELFFRKSKHASGMP
jgi:hypothetical protein